jgi:hypothetical protein
VYSFYPYLWAKKADDGLDVRVISADDSVAMRLAISGLTIA